MTTFRVLPAHPSLESLRKQAKRLCRDIAAANAEAAARARAQLPDSPPPLSQRDAQLVLAREYGFPGWADLIAEVHKRNGEGLEWAAIQGKAAIRDNDVERLKKLITEHPTLFSWRDEMGWSLLRYTCAFSDSFDPAREETYNRPQCAELLLDSGAVADPQVWEHVIHTRARGMLQLLSSKGVLPHTLLVFTALNDLGSVRACFDDAGTLRGARSKESEITEVDQAFLCASRFKHREIASLLLDRCIAFDPGLGKRIDRWRSRSAFIDYFGEMAQHFIKPGAPQTVSMLWRMFAMSEVMRTLHEEDMEAFTRQLRNEPWLLGESGIECQINIVENCSFNNREAFILRLMELNPALLRQRPPPQARAFGFAASYGHAHLFPLLMRIWPLPDDLPHAAAADDFDRVKRWFDAQGRPALGDPRNHFPGNSPHARANLHWGPASAQQVLDTALAWACLNRRFEIASFLLEHGADINTNWSTHEPASILHECAMHGRYDVAQFLIDHGIDMTIADHRWGGTAQGWAFHGANDEKMSRFLADAEEARKQKAT